VAERLSQDAARFLKESRAAFGYNAFVRHLSHMREEAVRTAIYGSDRETRGVHAGRAQALTELLALYTGSN
jgi:hypothetical protein